MTADAWAAIFTMIGVLLAGVALYAEHVFQRDRLTLTIVDVRLVDENDLNLTLLFANGGTRRVALVEMRPSVSTTQQNTRTDRVFLRDDRRTTVFPLVVAPGEIQQVFLVTTFLIGEAFIDDGIGQRLPNGNKAYELFLEVQVLDSSGQLRPALVPAFSGELAPRSSVKLVFNMRPHMILDVKNWVGALRV